MKPATYTFGNRSFMKDCVFERPFVASPGLNFINLTILPLHFLLFHLTIGKNFRDVWFTLLAVATIVASKVRSRCSASD